jgi:hypothetical protein
MSSSLETRVRCGIAGLDNLTEHLLKLHKQEASLMSSSLETRVRCGTAGLDYLAGHLEKLHKQEASLLKQLVKNEQETMALEPKLASLCPHIFMPRGRTNDGTLFSRCVICFHLQDGDGHAHNLQMETKFASERTDTSSPENVGNDEQGS